MTLSVTYKHAGLGPNFIASESQYCTNHILHMLHLDIRVHKLHKLPEKLNYWQTIDTLHSVKEGYSEQPNILNHVTPMTSRKVFVISLFIENHVKVANDRKSARKLCNFASVHETAGDSDGYHQNTRVSSALPLKSSCLN